VEQTRGEKKGQGQGLLREKEGRSSTTRRGTEVRKQRDEAEVGRSGLLDAFTLQRTSCEYPANYLRLLVFITRKRPLLRHSINSREHGISLWARWRCAVWCCPPHSGERRAGPVSRLLLGAVNHIQLLGNRILSSKLAVMHAE